MLLKFRTKTLSTQKNYRREKGVEAYNFITQMYSINL